MRSRTVKIIGVASLLLAARTATVHAEVIEQVVAVVNEEAILLSDLRRRAVPFLDQALGGTEGEAERMMRVQQVYRQLLDQMVDELLVEDAAQDMNLTVTAMEVDQAIDNVRSQNDMEEEQFWEAVQNQGYTKARYRSDVRKQLLRLKVINTKVRGRVKITDDEIRETYEQQVRQARRTLKFRADHILLELPEQATATDVMSARRRAQQIHDELSPENFEQHIAQYGGGELGWLAQGDMPAELEQTLLTLDEGEVSEPVRGPAGIHIFLLRERQTEGMTVPSFEEARDQIFNSMLETALAKQEQLFLEELRRQAVIKVHL